MLNHIIHVAVSKSLDAFMFISTELTCIFSIIVFNIYSVWCFLELIDLVYSKVIDVWVL